MDETVQGGHEGGTRGQSMKHKGVVKEARGGNDEGAMDET